MSWIPIRSIRDRRPARRSAGAMRCSGSATILVSLSLASWTLRFECTLERTPAMLRVGKRLGKTATVVGRQVELFTFDLLRHFYRDRTPRVVLDDVEQSCSQRLHGAAVPLFLLLTR